MKKQIYVVIFFLSCLLVITVNAAGKKAKQKSEEAVVSTKQVNEPKENLLKTEMDKVSYAIGTQIAQNFKKQGIEIRVEPLMQGLRDVMKDTELILSKDEMQQIMMSFQKRTREEQQERQKTGGTINLAEGKAFLEKNKKNKGVKELASGLQYKIIKRGLEKLLQQVVELKLTTVELLSMEQSLTVLISVTHLLNLQLKE